MAAEAQRQSTPQTRTFDLRSARPLLVDDSQQALDLLAQVLTGFQVRHAVPCRTVDEAIEQLDRAAFDFVIADAEMPDQDGLDLTRHMRSRPQSPNFTTPVIVVSASASQEKILRARDLGANAVLTKPIVPGVLLSRIERLARRPKPFVASDVYCGPDRRFKLGLPPEGVEERRAEALKLMAEPERAMSQDDIDSLFG